MHVHEPGQHGLLAQIDNRIAFVSGGIAPLNGHDRVTVDTHGDLRHRPVGNAVDQPPGVQ